MAIKALNRHDLIVAWGGPLPLVKCTAADQLLECTADQLLDPGSPELVCWKPMC